MKFSSIACLLLASFSVPAFAATSASNADALRSTRVADKSVRAAIRIGADDYRNEGHNYSSTGVEGAWFRDKYVFDALRAEAGGSATVLTSGVHPTVYAVHAFAGPGYQLDQLGIPGLVVGGRAMVGGVWDEQRKWQLDSGLEGRAGFEMTDFSVFAGLGQTKEFTRLGIDVGFFF